MVRSHPPATCLTSLARADVAAQGASLVNFRVEHPNVASVQRMLRVLDLDVTVTRAERAGLVADIDGPRGRVELR